ncbi:unnamed protein product [Parnassius apollo]|uniref:(apollo) hypothetical protein n=1 Tax=Parnassius apollo TaxID=110799 RepID=A0A8S3Y1V0_PARAO|nr:unnamed protein product [Parnassius apollo]
MPRLAIANGLKFPDNPDVLNELTSMEERLVSPHYVFLKIVRRGQGLGYQHGLSGNVINVPVKINNMVKALPRSINDDSVITVELKRKFCYKHGRKEQVRPEIIRRAAEYLVTCDLFRTYGIELEGSWTNNEPEDTVEYTCSSPAQESNVDEIPDVNPGGIETLLDENQDLTIVMAPGEGERPISLFFDRHLEELAFIKVHCAIERKYLVNLSHSEVTRSEISRNNRGAVRPDYLFTALKKQQTIAVKNNVTTCLRKKKTVRGAPVFACNVFQNNFVDNLVQHDDGYRVLEVIRNSPAHWKSEKKEVVGNASSIETLNDSSQAIDYSQAVEEVEAEGNWAPLQDNLEYIRKRTKTRIIRFRWYSYIDYPDNFYREQIMLYIPWRSEEEELLNPNINIKDIFDEYKERIKAESKQFNKLGDADFF